MNMLQKQINEYAKFQDCLAFTLHWEGGYSNHPNDKGGETNFGITNKVYQTYLKARGLPPKSIKDITLPEVSGIYDVEYFGKMACQFMPSPLNAVCFDWGVNSGVKIPIKALQRLLGLIPDGDVGRLTLEKLISLTNEEVLVLANQMIDKREAFFKKIGIGKNAVFLKGWLNRIQALREFIKK